MSAFFKNIIVQSIALFIAIVGGYIAFQYMTYQDAPATIDFAGTHIMADGSVMTGNGTVLPDAEILPDGTIQISDDVVITPTFDFRPNTVETSGTKTTEDVWVPNTPGVDTIEEVQAEEAVVETLSEEETIEMTETMETEEDTFDYSGLHIMTDGTVMDGNMQTIPGATILPDGTIELSDKTILTPVFDLRKNE